MYHRVEIQKNCDMGPQVYSPLKNHKKKESLTILTRSDKGSTYLPVTFKTTGAGPAVISNPSLLHENPVLSHWATEPQTRSNTHSLARSLNHSDRRDDIVHYGLARKYKKCEFYIDITNIGNW